MAQQPRLLKLDQLQLTPETEGPALKPLSFSVNRGQIAGLFCRHSGYLTRVLRTIIGLEPIQGGTLTIAGDHVASERHQWPVGKRRATFIPAAESLFPQLTIRANIELALLQRRRTERIQLSQLLLEQLDLQGYSEHYPHQLQEDSLQRSKLARALATPHPLILWDEPFNQPNPAEQLMLGQDMQQLAELYQKTVLFGTTNVDALKTTASMAGVIHHGELLQWDSPYNLYHAPNSRTVANIFGSATLLPGLLHVNQSLTSELGTLRFNQRHLANELGGKSVTFLVRPDDLQLGSKSDPTAVVIGKSFHGTESRYLLQLEEGSLLTLNTPSHNNIAIGKKIAVQCRMDHLIIFLAESEQSLDLGPAQSI